MGVSEARAPGASGVGHPIDWKRVLYLTLASRGLDDIEETRLVPERKVAYQFSARGHEMAQIILGSLLDHPHDAVGAYYRSRPILLTLGLSLEDAFAGPMGKSGGFSNGRDIGVVCNLPKSDGAIVLPMSGDVGSQYTPAAGWAQGLTYHRDVLGDRRYDGASILLTGPNFGSGSSREHAPWAIEDHGFKAVIAPSFADIFRNNCLKIGLLPIELREESVRALMDAALDDPTTRIEIDLDALTVRAPGLDETFDMEQFTRWRLMEGLDDIGLTLRHTDAIDAYEASRAAWLPSA